MADYVEGHARRYDLPIEHRVRVTPTVRSSRGERRGVWDMYFGDQRYFPACARSLAEIIVEDHSDKKLAKVIRAENIWAPLFQVG